MGGFLGGAEEKGDKTNDAFHRVRRVDFEIFFVPVWHLPQIECGAMAQWRILRILRPDGPHCEIGAAFQEIFKSFRVKSDVNLSINGRPVLNQLPSIEIRLHCSPRR